MNYRLVVFDFDGTLADTRATIVSTFRRTMEVMGLPVASEEKCASTIGLTLEKGFNAIFPEMTDAEASECACTYRKIFNENKKALTPELFPGVRETLERLKSEGYILTIASSRYREGTVGFLNEYGIADLFSLVFGAAEVEKPKPAPDAVVKTMEMLHFSPSETLVVGDMPFDILMGKGAGARTCGVTWGNSTAEELLQSGATYVIDSFKEIMDIIG